MPEEKKVSKKKKDSTKKDDAKQEVVVSEKKSKKASSQDQGELVFNNNKGGKHPSYYHKVKVVDINGYEFEVNATVPGPIKVETSHLSHPAYNPDKKIEKVAKGRVEKFNERMKRMEALKKKK